MQFSKDLSDSEDEDAVGVVDQKTSNNDTSESSNPESKLNGLSQKTESTSKNILKYFTSKPKSSTLLARYTELQSSNNTSQPESRYFFDDQISRLLSLLEEYFQIQKKIQTTLSDGFYSQSLAKYRQTTFSAQFPSTKDLKEELLTNIRMIPCSSVSEEWFMVEKEENLKIGKFSHEEKGQHHLSTENEKTETGILRIASEESGEEGVTDDFRSVGTVERTSSISEKGDDQQLTSSQRTADVAHNEEHRNDDDDDEEETNSIRVPLKCRIVLKEKSLENYLLSFHGLPSTKLKQCQKEFYSILSNDLCQVIFLKQQITQLCNEIEEFKGVISV
jgi:hypothetical protein